MISKLSFFLVWAQTKPLNLGKFDECETLMFGYNMLQSMQIRVHSPNLLLCKTYSETEFTNVHIRRKASKERMMDEGSKS